MIQRKAALSLAGAIVTSLILVYFVTLDYSRNILPKRISYNPPLSYDARNTSASGQEKAAFVILARNSDLGQILTSIQAVEDRFNNRHGHHYSYVFLNDEQFSPEFIASTSALISSNANYGLVPREHWVEPSWIDKEKASAARKVLAEKKVLYADSVSYRRMCRYQSGFFFRHELLKEYDYYWRVEPNIKMFCDVMYDPFKFMREEKKKYGFTLSIYEYAETIPTLWDATKDYMQKYPEHIAEDNSMYWVSDDKGNTYNRCHFWSNFEIGDLNFLRSKAYIDYFEHLDRAGGFSYERWGDAPVHSIAAALLLPSRDLHFFSDIGYRHEPFQHCPKEAVQQGCSCDPGDSFETHGYSCTNRWHELARNKGLE